MSSYILWDGFQSKLNLTSDIVIIFLILAENELNWKSYFWPNSNCQIKDDKRKSSFHLIGRILLLFAYVTLFRMEFSFYSVSLL